MIVFETPGELDIRAIKTFGVSSKEDRKTAIGYFGTGLKYAIAILLRHHQTIGIITGGQTYEFGINRSKIRFDEFDIVTMNGEELGFTTQLGKDWELWMAFRELYSNTLDENGTVTSGEKIPSYPPGGERTFIVVNGDQFENVYIRRDKYFLDQSTRKPYQRNHCMEAYEKVRGGSAQGTLFYRGIRAGETLLPAMYDYNFSAGMTLSEDRSIKSLWNVNWELGGLVMGSKNKKFIARMVTAVNIHEAELNYMGCTRPENIDYFLEVVGHLRNQLCDTGINQSAIQLHIQETEVKTVLPTESCELNDVEILQLERAEKFCKEVLELDIGTYPLIVCKHLGPDEYLGRADMVEGIMYISKQCFKEGTKRVAVAILEEYTHCAHSVLDETAEQKWVYLNQILSLGERIQGEPL